MCLISQAVFLFLMVLGSRVPLETWAEAADPEGQPPTESSVELAPVVVTGRADDLVGIASSASEGRVGQAELSTRPFLRPGEVLEVVPGVAVTQHSGTGKANQYFLRGFNLDHGTDFSTRVDGMPVNLPTHGHGQGYMDLNFVIPEIIDYIAYRKGPYYADVGDFSSAGTADIHLYRILPQGLVKLGVGEDNYYRLLVAASPLLGPGHLLYAVEGQYYDGPWVEEEDGRKFNGLLKYTLGSERSGLSLAIMGYYSKWNSTDQIPERAVTQRGLSRLGAIDPSDGGRTYRFSLSGDWWQKWGDGITRANVYLFYYRLNLFSNFTFFLDDPINGDQFEQVDRRIVTGGNVSHNWSTAWFKPMEHTVGLQIRYDHIPQVGLFKTQQRDRLSVVRDDEVNEASFGLYYQNQLQWADKVRTILGLRGDVYVFDVDSSLDVNSGDKTDAIFSPKLTVIFGPWSNTEVYLSGGFGFHSNDARGTTIQVDTQTGDPADPVDPLVRSKGAEIGVRSTFIRNLNSTIAFWYLHLNSELLFVGDAGTTEASRPSQRYGVELANFYRPLSWLTLDIDFAYTWAEFTDNDPAGDHIPGALQTTLAAGATVNFPFGLFGSLRARYFGPRPLIEDNSVESESTLIFNLQAGYTYKNLVAQLDVLNLFNSKDHDIDYFYASRLPGEPAAGVEDIHFHPMEPRTVRFYLTYKF